MQKRRLTREEQAELVQAIKNDEIENATAFAQEFAEQHGLNPATVRSRISRLRRELGVLTRQLSLSPPRQDADPFPSPTAIAAGLPGRPGLVRVLDDDTGAAEIAAAALVRYEEDEAFRRAVDRRRADMKKLYVKLREVRAAAEAVGQAERDEIVRLLISKYSST